MNLDNVKISVCMITYGHEKYIAQAIEGILMQEVDFDYELIIANDRSPDNTDEVVNSYLNNHPKGSKIKYFSHQKNIGANRNFLFSVENATGEYIALCEGDDYWTDPLKLQKQVDFLEKNQKYVLCGHYIDKLNFKGEIQKNMNLESLSFTQSEMYDIHIPTLSAVFRNKLKNTIPEEFLISPTGDFLLWTYLGSFGDYYLMNSSMAVYREHIGGVWSGISAINKIKNSIVTRTLALKFVKDKKETLLFNSRICRGGINESLKQLDFKNLFFFTKLYANYLFKIINYNKMKKN